MSGNHYKSHDSRYITLYTLKNVLDMATCSSPMIEMYHNVVITVLFVSSSYTSAKGGLTPERVIRLRLTFSQRLKTHRDLYKCKKWSKLRLLIQFVLHRSLQISAPTLTVWRRIITNGLSIRHTNRNYDSVMYTIVSHLLFTAVQFWNDEMDWSGSTYTNLKWVTYMLLISLGRHSRILEITFT